MSLDEAREVLSRFWGHSSFRPGQEVPILAALRGEDSLVVLPTGGGKSVVYQVPALLRSGLTLVVSPLISLMKDQVDNLQRRGVPAALLNSTLEYPQVQETLRSAEKGLIRLLYVAPERFDSEMFRSRLPRLGVGMLVVDEAHCIVQWGREFRPAYLRLAEARALLGEVPLMALTATATSEVRREIVSRLELRSPQVSVTGFDRPNLSFRVRSVSTSSRVSVVGEELRKAGGSAIVYASTVKDVKEVVANLKASGLMVDGYHGGLGRTQRGRVQNAFMSGKLPVVVATSAFGMGVDKPDVRLVVHYKVPGTIEAYYQEAGRAGRDGKQATCVLLYDGTRDGDTHRFFAELAFPRRECAQEVWRGLKSLKAGSWRKGVTVERLLKQARERSRYKKHQHEAGLRKLLSLGWVAGGEEEPLFWAKLLESNEGIRARAREGEKQWLRILFRHAGEELREGQVLPWSILPGRRDVASRRQMRELAKAGFIEWKDLCGKLWSMRGEEEIGGACDWLELGRERERSIEELERVLRFAEGRVCRTAYLLEYFGEENSGTPCQRCDVCLAKAQPGR